MPEDHAVWVYAITDEPVPHIPTPGVDGEALRHIRTADLTALVGDVPVSRFGEVALRHNLENVEWLGAVATAHHAIVARVCRAVAAIPMRLATVFLDDNRVKNMMDERVFELHAVLDPLRGRDEWGVKGFIAGAAATDNSTALGSPTHDSGTGYLLQRRAQLRDREQNTQEAHGQARAIHQALSDLAVQDRTHPPQDPKLTPGRTMVLNGAYLVDASQIGTFKAAVSETKPDRLDLELTGPWPPYSFIGAVEPAI